MIQERDILTRKEAQKRSSLISEVSYDLQLSLKKNSKTYEGKCSIHFTLRKKSPIFLNTTSKIKKLSINGAETKDFKQTKFRLEIPKKLLKKKYNTISIFYVSNYDHTGDGLHQFIDIEDKNEYIYSNFEPFAAHRMFPCFDQPDIKANLSLEVIAPKDWEIISNSLILNSKSSGPMQKTKFKQTPKISTYIFHVSAGPYYKFEDKYKDTPLRIYCRNSIKKYFPVKDIFKITKQGLAFYEKFFNFNYPFEKYDQIFVPEFNSGAMENAGAVTFNEAYIKRRELTYTEKSRLANVILHEMTHMWFGDLVTMKWWDDLWLNESFADFLSYFAMVNATEFKTAWQDFYARKSWAYIQDQMPTTHPITADASDTEIAVSNFDGISYSKGASVLKQLMFFISEEDFKKGIQNYFKKHQWKNTELSDFKNALEKSSNKNLKEFFKSWLSTTGVNTIQIQPKKGNLYLKQFPSKNGKIRQHKTQLALFSSNKISSIPLTYKSSTTRIKPGRAKIPAFDFIFPNFGDYDYVKVRLENKSISFLLDNLSQLKEDLTKQMIYGTFWDMLRDAQFSPSKFLDLILKNSPNEKNLLLLERFILYSKSVLEYYTNDNKYLEYSKKLNALSFNQLKSKKVNHEHKNAWLSLYLYTSPQSNKSEELTKILENKIKFPDFKLDQDQRWEILIQLSLLNSRSLQSLLKKELKKDKSDLGRKSAARVESALLKNKEKFWKIFTSKNNLSLDYQREAMASFHNRFQSHHLNKFTEKFFSSLKKVSIDKDPRFSDAFASMLFPSNQVNNETIIKTREFLKSKPKLPKDILRIIIENLDNLKRFYNVRDKFN